MRINSCRGSTIFGRRIFEPALVALVHNLRSGAAVALP